MVIQARLQDFPQLKRRQSYKNNAGHGYAVFKLEIREDCKNRCVYCDAHEDEIGGDGMFHLDHFRPQKYFPLLVSDPVNLLWVCCRCNLLKRDHWPAKIITGSNVTFIGEEGFIDPFLEDRNSFFCIDSSGKLIALQPPANFIIDRLALNRPFLRLNRRRRELVRLTLKQLEVMETTIIAKKRHFEDALQNNDIQNSEVLQELLQMYELYLELVSNYRDTIELLF